MEKKIALVTGTSRGIGKAIVLELASQGFYVVGTEINDDLTAQIDAYLKEAGLEGEGRTLDVTDAAAVEEVIKSISADLGAPAVLVNNAGITRDNLLMRMKDDEWESVINTNLTSVYRLCKACMRGMTKARFGRIINIASVVGLSGNAGQTNYCSAKSGVIGFTKALAREVGARGITVNAVAPGFIVTEMTDKLTDEQKQAMLAQIPVGRAGNVDDIAAAVAYLASENAGFMTGETLNVSGGMYM